MKRDLDLIRDFLFRCEASDEFRFPYLEHAYIAGDFRDLLPHGWDMKMLYHYELLKDAGFVVELDKEFPPTSDDSGITVHFGKFRLSNAGHDYIDAIRNESVWAKTRDAVAEQGGSMALEIVKQLAMGYAKTLLRKQTGIDI